MSYNLSMIRSIIFVAGQHVLYSIGEKACFQLIHNEDGLIVFPISENIAY